MPDIEPDDTPGDLCQDERLRKAEEKLTLLERRVDWLERGFRTIEEGPYKGSYRP